jgi:hypothetical protein
MSMQSKEDIKKEGKNVASASQLTIITSITPQ